MSDTQNFQMEKESMVLEIVGGYGSEELAKSLATTPNSRDAHYVEFEVRIGAESGLTVQSPVFTLTVVVIGMVRGQSDPRQLELMLHKEAKVDDIEFFVMKGQYDLSSRQGQLKVYPQLYRESVPEVSE